MFFVYYFFVCIKTFYIFLSAMFDLYQLITEFQISFQIYFYFLKFITMFLPVNMLKFCKQIFNSYCKCYIWKQSFKGSLSNSYLIYTWEIPVENSIYSGAAVQYLPFQWEWPPTCVSLKYFNYLLCELLFFGELPLVAAS